MAYPPKKSDLFNGAALQLIPAKELLPFNLQLFMNVVRLFLLCCNSKKTNYRNALTSCYFEEV